MWKIYTSRLNEVYKFTDTFVEEILTWAIKNQGLTSVNMIPTSIIGSKLFLLSHSCKELNSHMLKLSQCKDIASVLELFQFNTFYYEQILDGVKPIREMEIEMETVQVVKQVFKYFYTSLLDNVIFWETYNPNNTMITKKEFRDRIGQKIKVCPYCDMRKIVVPIMSNMDHFLPISKYPLLGIHWRNLIVSCADCNGILVKQSRTLLPIFHPYFDEVNQKVIFNFNIKEKEINIYPSSSSNTEQIKAQNFIDLFYLQLSYSRLWDEVQDEHEYLAEDILNNYDKEKKKFIGSALNQLIKSRISKRKNHHYSKARKLAYTKLKLDYCDHLQDYAERFLLLESKGEKSRI